MSSKKIWNEKKIWSKLMFSYQNLGMCKEQK